MTSEQRPPFRVRLRYALWNVLGRIVLNRFFMHFVLGPLIMVGQFMQACFYAFGPAPKFKISPGSVIPSGMMELIARVHEQKEAQQTRTELTDRERTVTQSTTWGVAGVSVVILTAIATSSKTFTGPAISIAAGCFAVTIPLLIVYGLAFSHHWEPVRGRPAGHETLNLHSLIFGAHFLFVIGLAALLCSFNVRVSIAFLAACVLGWRAHQNLVVHRIAPKTAESLYSTLKAANSGEIEQAAATSESGKTAA